MTSDGHRVPNMLGGRRYNRTCFIMPSRKRKGQIQFTGSKIQNLERDSRDF